MDIPKFKIGEKVYVVQRDRRCDLAKVFERTVVVVMKDKDKIFYNLSQEEQAFEEIDIFIYDEAIDFMLNYKVGMKRTL